LRQAKGRADCEESDMLEVVVAVVVVGIAGRKRGPYQLMLADFAAGKPPRQERSRRFNATAKEYLANHIND